VSVLLRAPREVGDAIARKPRYGLPCNGCGACCMVTLCKLARHVFHADTPFGRCPALTKKDDGTYGCGLVEKGKGPQRDAALLLIGAGDGCDARFNGEPRDEALSAQWDKRDEDNAAALDAALKTWSGS
jgi:hypothetical protein